MTWDADCLMDTERTTMVQRRPDIYNQYTKRIMNAMTKGSHPWGAGSISKRLFPLIEDAMRHLENGTAAMFDYLIHDGRKTIELDELSTLIPEAWSINRKYVNALNSTERNNNNNNNNCLKSNIQCIEIRVQWTMHLGSSHMHVHAVTRVHAVTPKLVICIMYLTSI